MKLPCFILLIFFVSSHLCAADEFIYKVKPNKERFPFPTFLPDVPADDLTKFDWNRYIKEARSPADKAYRAHQAPNEFWAGVPGAGNSNSDDFERATIAKEELLQTCAVFEAAYRKHLQADHETLKVLETFIKHRTAAMEAEAMLIGGSWGGSGAKTAWAASRMTAAYAYLEALRGLGDSLHFQDMPELHPYRHER